MWFIAHLWLQVVQLWVLWQSPGPQENVGTMIWPEYAEMWIFHLQFWWCQATKKGYIHMWFNTQKTSNSNIELLQWEFQNEFQKQLLRCKPKLSKIIIRTMKVCRHLLPSENWSWSQWSYFPWAGHCLSNSPWQGQTGKWQRERQ